MALLFDAAGDYLRRTTNAPDLNGSVTVTYWVKFTSFANGYQCPFSIDIDIYDYWYAEIDTAGGQFSIYEMDGQDLIITEVIATLSTNTWYFVALSREGAAEDTSGYIAAASASALTSATLVAGGNTHAADQRVWIGNNTFSEYANGAVAAVKIWTAALTQAEIELERYRYAPVRKSDLWGYFPLIAPSDYWVDRGPYRYDMTPAGTLTWADNPPIPNERIIVPPARKLILPIWLASGGIQTFSHAASGGLTTGGTATLQRTRAIVASGGLTTGSAATLARTQVHTVSGGLTVGGTATAAKTALFTHAAAGGLTTGGAATLARTQVHPISGGLTAGGVATLARTQVSSVSGGLTAGGAATLARTQVHAVAGGLTASGTAPASYTSAGSFSYVATGGLTAGGSITVSRAWAVQALGGMATSGASALARTWAYPVTGGLTTGGAAPAAKTALFVSMASGGATLGGAAILSTVATHLASGGAAFSGAAGLNFLLNHWASGGLVAGGTAAARVASASSASAVEVALELLDNQYLEPGITVRNGLRLILAALAGKVAGADTDTVTIRNPADTVTRITATVDQYGNRLVVTYDLSDG